MYKMYTFSFWSFLGKNFVSAHAEYKLKVFVLVLGQKFWLFWLHLISFASFQYNFVNFYSLGILHLIDKH
jgi:hypothetical protein